MVLLLVLLCVVPTAAESACPEGPDAVAARVSTAVDYDPQRRLYRYRYRVAVAPESPLSLITLALRGEPPLLEVRTPEGWSLTRLGGEGSRLFWDVPGPTGLRPGEHQGGFTLRSPNPPAPAPAYLLGRLDYGAIRRRIVDERLPVECAALFSGSFREQARVMSTVVPNTFVRASVRVFPDDPDRSLDPTSEAEIPVVLLNADTLPLEDLAAGSVRAGPALVKPRWGSGHRVDVNGDRLTDRLFHVRAARLGLRCGHGRIVVTGWFRDSGVAFQGLGRVRVRGCG